METRVDIDFHETVSIYFSFIWFSFRVEGERTLCFILDILQKDRDNGIYARRWNVSKKHRIVKFQRVEKRVVSRSKRSSYFQ